MKEDKYLKTTRIKYPSIYTLVRLPSFQSMLFVTLSLSPRNITSVCYILNISFCFCVHYCLLCSLYVLVLYIYLISNCCKYHKYNNPTSCCKYNGSPAARKISPWFAVHARWLWLHDHRCIFLRGKEIATSANIHNVWLLSMMITLRSPFSSSFR